MSGVRVQFLGSGDAFGSGGRFQTCICLSGSGEGSLLIDAGASSLIAMKRAEIDPSGVGWVVLSHLHGDHFGGLPFLVLDGQFSKRERPLVIAGPSGVQSRVEAAMEVLFPRSSGIARAFELNFVELVDGKTTEMGPAAVTPHRVEHESGAPSFALHLDYGGRVIAYSGDTEWTDALLDAARGADLFICEAYFYEKKMKFHLDYQTLLENLERFEARRIILTHMSADMLARANVDLERAVDGMVIEL